MPKIWKLTVSIAIPLLAGAIGSVFTAKSVSTWYATLAKPAINPPNWLFGPVWTALYIMMGIALYIVWEAKREKRKAFTLFGTQLALNAFWSILFFGMRQPFYAFIEIIALWAAILMTIISFYKVKRTAAYLLLPYILWVSYAAVLNYFLFALN